MKDAAVVIGGYVNGYSIVNELYANNTKNIIVIDQIKNIASYSNKITKYYKSPLKEKNIKNIFNKLLLVYDSLVLFPTSEEHIRVLNEIKNDFGEEIYFPFNDNVLKYIDKDEQYKLCEKLDIPYPKSLYLKKHNFDISEIELTYPLIIKPFNKKEFNEFRTLRINDLNDMNNAKLILIPHLKKGIGFIISELVEGPSSNIYSYNLLIGKNGDILEGWGGRKLTQSPDDFGVMSTTSNECNQTVKEYSIKLANKINPIGIFEPEFKYDERDGQFKLIEIGFRPTMWNKVGYFQGTFLNQNMYNDALSLPLIASQKKQNKVIMIYFKHEFLNLLFRKKYLKTFLKYTINTKHKNFTIYDNRDLKPFIYDIYRTLKLGGIMCIKNIKTK